jgi:CheY-like chemotaxis protein
VCLSVRDTGCGMDEQTQAHIFEPFFTTKTPDKGTGLGLSTAYCIVAQSGGRIEVDSARGRGTTMRVLLPCADVPEEAARPAGAPAGPCPGDETILLVEDDPLVRRYVRRGLEGLGYRVLAAAAAREALDHCARAGADIRLLLSDVVMPGMNGPDLGRIVRERVPGVRVLFMSGYVTDSASGNGVSQERPDVLRKPFSLGELASRVRAALDDRTPVRR